MEYNKYIDHTLLKSDATIDDIFLLCEEAKKYHFASVCVNPCFVPFAKSYLENSDVKVCTVVGFPLGATFTRTKVDEAMYAIKEGADEIDMVINIGMLKAHQYDYVQEEISLLREVTMGYTLKVIIETCLLTKEEIIKVSEIIKECKADFVKTSTGYSKGGATIDDVKLIKSVVKDETGIKASGGIRTHEDMVNLIEAGATRIGTSSGTKIL